MSADALLFGDRGRVARAGAIALALIACGLHADRVLAPREPAMRDLLTDPSAFEGDEVAFITHDTTREGPAERAPLVLSDGPFRLEIAGAHPEVPTGMVVSVRGVFETPAGAPPRVDPAALVTHPLRPWKQRVSGLAVVALAAALCAVFRVRRGRVELRCGGRG